MIGNLNQVIIQIHFYIGVGEILNDINVIRFRVSYKQWLLGNNEWEIINRDEDISDIESRYTRARLA